MTTKYVSVSRGNDTTGDGSAATPWKTIDKAIGAGGAFTLDTANPNTLYIEPGIYREAINVTISPTSAGTLSIIGDVDGGGFAAGGYASAVTGLVDWRAWSDDHTPLSASCIQGNGASYITISRIKFIGGDFGHAPVYMASGANWTVSDCNLVSHTGASRGNLIEATATQGVALNLTVDRCRLYSLSTGGAIKITFPGHTADWTMGLTVRNSLIAGSAIGVYVNNSGGSGTFAPGGIAVQNCTIITNTNQVSAYGTLTNIPASPMTVYGCTLVGNGLKAGATGQVVADGNLALNSSTNNNVTTGANSVTLACPAFDFGDNALLGLPMLPFGTPSAVSPANGFGSYGTTPTVDLTGRNRPEGTGSTAPSVGCLERHDTGVQDKVYQDSGSSACLKLVGPSSQERLVLVDAVATTLTVKVRWDGNHGDTNKPQAILVAEPQIGVAGQTITATSTGGTGSTPNAYETLTFSNFTPTAKGAVKLRLVSRAAAGSGAAYFDTISL